jgi:hypothetical protein
MASWRIAFYGREDSARTEHSGVTLVFMLLTSYYPTQAHPIEKPIMRVLTQSTKNLLYRDLYDLIPIYLAPALPNHTLTRQSPIRDGRQTRRITTTPRRRLGLSIEPTLIAHHDQSPINAQAKLPLACPGCGAPTQTVYEGDAGYYSLGRTSVRNFTSPRRALEQDVVKQALGNVPESLRQELGIDVLKGEKSLGKRLEGRTLTQFIKIQTSQKLRWTKLQSATAAIIFSITTRASP